MPEQLPSAIGYVRVSTEEQATEGVSLEAQRAKVVAYCGLHGLSLAQTYADEGLSGKRADNRPGLQQAITHACNCHGVLIVYSLSRLARSTRDAIDIAERLAKSKADLVSITEKIDTTTSMGRFFFTTVAALAQLERDQISERTAMALAHKRAKGERVSGPLPYGYRLGDVNANVVDRFYGTASTSPGLVYPRLFKAAQQHLGKLQAEKPGMAVNLQKDLEGLCAVVNAIPRLLTLSEQGEFALGFYHQRAAYRKGRESKINE